MMPATYELQYAIVQALRNNEEVKKLVNNRIYDRIPDDAKFPYLTIGAMFSNTGHYDCMEIDEVTIQIDAWSRAVGYPEVRKLNDAVRWALTKNELKLEDNGLISFKHEMTREMRDPDGLTSHGINTFEANIQRF